MAEDCISIQCSNFLSGGGCSEGKCPVYFMESCSMDMEIGELHNAYRLGVKE